MEQLEHDDPDRHGWIDFRLQAARRGAQSARDGLRTGFVLPTVLEPTNLHERLLATAADVPEVITGAVGTRALAQAEAIFGDDGLTYEREIGSGDPSATLVDIPQCRGCTGVLMGGARVLGALRGCR
jgi:hypothetical protein